jgi:hypothetical protein
MPMNLQGYQGVDQPPGCGCICDISKFTERLWETQRSLSSILTRDAIKELTTGTADLAVVDISDRLRANNHGTGNQNSFCFPGRLG